MDNVICLYDLYELIKHKMKKIYSASIDFEKKFSIKYGARYKLLSNVNGKMLNVIKNIYMYKNIKLYC